MKRREREHQEAGVGLSTSAPSYRLKVDRAQVHLDSLNGAVERFLKENCRAVIEFEAETNEHVMSAQIDAQPPAYLSVVAGDCVHDLRSALSHLAFDLAQANSTGPLSEAAEKGLDFPICESPESFRSQRNSRIKWIAPAAQELIEAMQPYQGDDWRPLAFVHELNRVDKHRKLNLVTASLKRNTALVNANKSFTFTAPGPIEDGAQLMRWQAPRGNSKKEPEPQADAAFNVVLGEGPFERDWLVTNLRRAADLVRDRVIPTLEPHL